MGASSPLVEGREVLLDLGQRHPAVELVLRPDGQRVAQASRICRQLGSRLVEGRSKRDGARAVKWLPSAMGIDPASAKCDRFYEALNRLDLPLIAHAGLELVPGGSGVTIFFVISGFIITHLVLKDIKAKDKPAMSAEGKSTIHNIEQIDRGYQNIDTRLNKIGAEIKRL